MMRTNKHILPEGRSSLLEGAERAAEKNDGPPMRDNVPLRKSARPAPQAAHDAKIGLRSARRFRGRASPLRSGAQETTLRDVAVFPRGTWTTPTSPSERRRTWCSRRGRRAFDEESEALTCVPSCLDDVNARPLLIANDNAIALAA